MRSFRPFCEALRRSILIAYFTNVLPFFRQPLWSINYAITPLAIIFFAGIYGGTRIFPYALIGGIVAITVAATIVVESDIAHMRVLLRLQDVFVASPAGPLSYYFGIAIGNLLTTLPALAVLLAVMSNYVTIGLREALIILGCIAMLWASVSALGFVIGSRAKELKDLWTYSPILTVFLTILPPVYYPRSFLPEVLVQVASLSPTYVGARIMQAALGIEALNSSEPLNLFLGTMGFIVIIGVLLRKYVKWQDS